ncbi:MAG: hypothetical protein AB1656_05830 [Candidatus Omnitrophota bacterium]
MNQGINGEPAANHGISLRIPIVLTIVFALVHALALIASEKVLFAYSNRDCLTLLFSRSFFQMFPPGDNTSLIVPLQNIHALLAGAIYAAQRILSSSLFWLWIGQTILFALFMGSLIRFQRRWLESEESLPFWILLAVHPILWMTAQFSPSAVLTSIIFIETLNRYPQRDDGLNGYFLTLVFLSASGAEGFLLAAIIAVFPFLFAAIKIDSVKTERRDALAWLFAPLLAVAPMGFAYLFLSIQYGAFGGLSLAEFPGFFAELNLVKMLTGEWPHRFQQGLLFWGNGGLDLPFPVPIFGFLAMAGAAYWLMEGGKKEEGIFLLFILAAFGAAASFLPLETSKEIGLIVLPPMILLAVRGIYWAAKSEMKLHRTVLIVMTGVIGFLAINLLPMEYRLLFTRAGYWNNIHSSIERAFAYDSNRPDTRRAVRFSPALFAHFSDWEKLTPLSLDYIRHSFPALDWEPIFPDSYARQPLVLFPTFKEALAGKPSSFESRWRGSLSAFFESTRIQNVNLYIPRKEKAGRFPVMETERCRLAGDEWTYENGYLGAKRIGMAFRRSPQDDEISAGNRLEAEQTLGTLESQPFIIAGDELRFWASMPKEATASVICLAVFEKSPYGDELPIREARSIFQRHSGEPLLGSIFYYVRPQQLKYSFDFSHESEIKPLEIGGWRVVRALHGGGEEGWGPVRWSLDPWRNRQAIWMAASRDAGKVVRLDHVAQVFRPPGRYWNFENGSYSDWTASGAAFGAAPVCQAIGGQSFVEGAEGNYFVDSYFNGSDEAQGLLLSPEFIVESDHIVFLLGGGDDPDRTYVGLLIDGAVVLRAAGKRSEKMERVVWDIRHWRGKKARLEIVDASSEPWGHILADDFRITGNAEK